MGLVPTYKAALQRSRAGNMLQISQTCWQNLAVVFSGLWASTHVLSDEPSHAWQSLVLLAQLGTGFSLSRPSAPAFPMTRCLGQRHYFYVYNMQQGSHHSSQELFCCPQPSVILCFAQMPCPACLCFSPYPLFHAQNSGWPGHHHEGRAQRAGCLGEDTKCL